MTCGRTSFLVRESRSASTCSDPAAAFKPRRIFAHGSFLLAVPFKRGLAKHQDWDWLLRATNTPGVRLVVVPDALSIYWVPQHRPSIANSGTWRTSLQWAQQNRVLLTPRAYSQFIIAICARRAAEERAGVRSFVRLLRESVVGGSPTPWLLLQLALLYCIPARVRAKLRERFGRAARMQQCGPYITQNSTQRSGAAL